MKNYELPNEIASEAYSLVCSCCPSAVRCHEECCEEECERYCDMLNSIISDDVANFSVHDAWKTDTGLKALAERKVSPGNNLPTEVATLTYPSIQFTYDAFLKSGNEPCLVEDNDPLKGEISFAVLAVLGGMPPESEPHLADDEYGLMWETEGYIDTVVDIDFGQKDWEEALKNRLVRIAEDYVKKNGRSFFEPNF